MLECRFCKRIPNESSINNLSIDEKEFVNSNNLKYFLCECGLDWVEVDNDKELFNLDLFGKKIKSYNDFKELINILNNELSYYKAVPIIKDCLLRINDWLTTGENIDILIKDSYIKNQIAILLNINDIYYNN